MNGKEGKKSFTKFVDFFYFGIIYLSFLNFRAAEEEARRNAAKAFNDRVENLGVTLSEFEKHIIKV